MDAAALIRTLDLQRHPEGGWYRETFRDSQGGARGASTAIYYLLEKGDRSHWHRVRDAAEVWHHYAGSAMRLSMSEDGKRTDRFMVGPDVLGGQQPQCVVPANFWQSAEPCGDWSLVGCTVAPGFVFESFELAPPDWQPGS